MGGEHAQDSHRFTFSWGKLSSSDSHAAERAKKRKTVQ